MEYPLVVDVIRFFGIAGRIGGFTMAVPVLGSQPVSMRMRALLVVATTVALLPMVPSTWFLPDQGAPIGVLQVLILVGAEVALGLVVALILRCFLEAFTFAGELIGIHMGFAFAQQVDPTLGQSTSLLGRMMSLAFLMIFLAAGGHFFVIQMAAHSFSVFPPGGLALNDGIQGSVVEASARLLTIGLRLSLPVFCMILFVDIGLALMTKFGEEFQVLMLSFPIRIGLGIFILAATAPIIVPWGRNATMDALAEIWLLQVP